MLRTAKDCLRIREEKLNIYNKSQEEIKGQMKLIESKVMSANIGYRTKYINIGNVGKLFKENEKKIIKDGYYIIQDDKNDTRLYFDEEDYNNYVNSNKKVKEAIKNCSTKYTKALNKLKDDIETDEKTDLKKEIMNEFFESWNYLNNLDCVYYDGINRFDLCFYLEVVKVDPDTMKTDNNSSKNTKTQVWLEFGEAVWNDDFKCVMGTHNINLDCGADTFEEAVIKLAKLCKEKGLKERY